MTSWPRRSIDEINYTLNAPLKIDGGEGEDILRVIATEFLTTSWSPRMGYIVLG